MWPVQSAVATVFSWGHDVSVSLIHARELAEENRKLKAEIDRLTYDKMLLHENYLENKQIKEKLGFVLRGEEKGVTAIVIGRSTGPNGPAITIRSVDGREFDVGNIVREEKCLL